MLVHVSGEQLTIPHECACCGREPDAHLPTSATRVTGRRVIRTYTQYWNIPYCADCVRHINAYPPPTDGCVTAILVVFTLGVGLIFTHQARKNAIARAVAMCSAECASVIPSVAFVGWHSRTNSFHFSSPRYAGKFMMANARKLISLSIEARQFLETFAEEQAALARASLPSGRWETGRGGDDEAEFMSAIAKLEAAKGAASRRTIRDRALRSLQSTALRERLLLEAGRIEVDAALAKADSLKTVAAKRRHLEQALDHLKSDEVPDDLQQQEFEALRQALAELKGG